jgi:hypothetical protein
VQHRLPRSIYSRANRWAKNGVPDRAFAALQESDIINIILNFQRKLCKTTSCRNIYMISNINHKLRQFATALRYGHVVIDPWNWLWKFCCGSSRLGLHANVSVEAEQYFKALSGLTRLRMLMLLNRERELCVCELTHAQAVADALHATRRGGRSARPRAQDSV